MAFPRDDYKAFLVKLFDEGATLYWKGAPEPFFSPIGAGTPVVVRIDVGDSIGYGTSELRRIWFPQAHAGAGAYGSFVLQRMTWPLTIDVETFDSDNPGEDFLMVVRGKLRWPSSIAAIQDMGLTTIRVGDVNSEIRQADDHETFGAVLMLTHGQCYTSPVTDDDGQIITNVASLVGTITGGAPDPSIVTNIV